MNRKIDYKINENDTGKTVESFLKEHGYTHQVLVRLKQTDHGILRNGIWAYTNERLCKDDLITVQIVENECSDNISPVNLPLDIAYEDDDIIVINKPFDMPAHPSAGNHDNTLANALMYYYGSQNKPFVYRYHRAYNCRKACTCRRDTWQRCRKACHTPDILRRMQWVYTCIHAHQCSDCKKGCFHHRAVC